jgi:hypothetical protein
LKTKVVVNLIADFARKVDEASRHRVGVANRCDEESIIIWRSRTLRAGSKVRRWIAYEFV